MQRNYLIIFLRYPEPGQVKTRLARAIGDKLATELYCLFVNATLNRLSYKSEIDKGHLPANSNANSECDYEILLFFTPEGKEAEIRGWLGNDYQLYPQIGENLGERMFNAFRTTFSLGAKKAIIIGTDTPALERQLIRHAFDLLDQSHVVIGHTEDGGYYLLGLSFYLFAGRNHLSTNSTPRNFKIRGRHGQTSLSMPDSRPNRKPSIVNDPYNAVTDNFESGSNFSSFNNLYSIFYGIEWGADTVYEETIKRIKQNQLTYQLLPEHYDIDRPEDLHRLKRDMTHKKGLNMDYLLRIRSLLDNLEV